MTDPADQSVSLAAVTAAAAAQLKGLGERCQALQHALGPVCDPAAMARVQDLDLVTQSLEALAAFLADLSAAVPPSLAVDARPALARIPLSDLAAALDPRSAAPVAPAAAGGDLDLFL